MITSAPLRTANKITSSETPCVGICSTIYGDDLCRGCFRTAQEVVDWNAYRDSQKIFILQRLNTLTTDITATKLTVTDAVLLKAKCQEYNIKIRDDFSPYTWAHALLRQGIHQIKDIKKYGICVHDKFNHLSLAKLIELIDDELLTT